MTLRILDPGLYTILVDFGRTGWRSLGVPVGGAADRFALAIGNGLVGNAPNCAALEMSLAGPTMRSDCELICVVYGAEFVLASDRQPLTVGKTFRLQPGEELRIGGVREHLRAYFCVRGGFEAPMVLGSRSGLEPVSDRAELNCGADLANGPRSRISSRFVRPNLVWNREPRLIRVLEGPQADWFHENEFYFQEFTISPVSNRMGLRLHGLPLTRAARELVSEPVCPGTVQLTRDGQCIILGVDGQTIGGYPKIAQVITADLDKLGQLRPNDGIHFVKVNLDEAESLYRQKQAEMREWLTRLHETSLDNDSAPPRCCL
jgi:biotin-dependent carboxylase-like uncharacterized protein